MHKTENKSLRKEEMSYGGDTLYRGRISFRFARIKIYFKISIITHFNGEIDSHIWMLRESLRESILGFSPNF